MSLRNGMTDEGFIHFCQLINLNKIHIVGYYESLYHDINLSPAIIDKFVNINEFYCSYENISPVKGVKGFLYIKELRTKLNQQR
jgi:hypothetical protein